MNKLVGLFVVLMFAATGSVIGNDSCTILLNNRVIFKGEVDQENNVASIKTNRFKSTDYITIRYCTENAVKGWKRTFYLDEANDRNLKQVELGKQSGSVSIKGLELNEMKEKAQPISIYTISLPIDKKKAARIRVRRMFICKIEWN